MKNSPNIIICKLSNVVEYPDKYCIVKSTHSWSKLACIAMKIKTGIDKGMTHICLLGQRVRNDATS